MRERKALHMRNWITAALVLPSVMVVGLVVAGAGDVENGKKIFHNSGKSSNGLACITCHDTAESLADGILRPAHPMTNVLGRPTFWGGTLTTFGEASDFCAVKYMQIEGLSASDKADLESYVAGFGKEPQPALVLAKRTRKQIADVGKLAGDPARGKEIVERSCIQCHSKKGPAPAMDQTLSPASIIVIDLSTGGKFMPFFSADRLSDQQVADVAAYVSSINRSSK